MSDREKFTTISHLVPGSAKYYNVFCQVISCYTCPRGYVYLRVWDGTRNHMGSLISGYLGLNLIYGDEVKEKRVAADNKLFEVTCYDEHGRAATALKPGDYVALVNVHFHIPTNCRCPALVMHSGPGKIRTHQGFKSAGRKILLVTPTVSRTGFNFIDGLIKTHEATLPQVHVAATQEQPANDGVSDDTWNEFLGIEPTEVAPVQSVESPAEVAPAQPQSAQVPAEVAPAQSQSAEPPTEVAPVQFQSAQVPAEVVQPKASPPSTHGQVSEDLESQENGAPSPRLLVKLESEQSTQAFLDKFKPGDSTQKFFDKLKPEEATQSFFDNLENV